MKDFSPFQAVVMTFFSAPFYKDLLRNGKGLGFLYLFVLLLFCWCMETAKVFTSVQTAVNGKDVAEFVAQVPSLTMKDDKLSIDKPSPYMIKDPTTGEPLILFDMTGNTKDLEHANGAKALITSEYFVAEKSTGAQETLPWSQLKSDFTIENSMLKEAISKIPTWLTIAFFALGIFVWMGHLIMALMYGVAGLIMDSKKLGYATMVRLASFAMTPAIMISTILFLVGLDFKFFGMLSIAITLGFMYFGNQAVLKDDGTPLA